VARKRHDTGEAEGGDERSRRIEAYRDVILGAIDT
jgi:hypothetical protein